MVTDFLTPGELTSLGLAAVGEGVEISRHALFFAPERIQIGAHTRIDAFAVLAAGAGGIRIGRNVHISAHATILGAGGVDIDDFSTVSVRCSIFSSNDDYSGATLTNPTVPAELRGVLDAQVRIGPHAIVGAGSVVLPGVTIGESSAVGALSVVKQDVPPFSIAAGVPARIVGRRRAEHRDLAAAYLNELTNAHLAPAAEEPIASVPAAPTPTPSFESFPHVLAHLAQLQEQVNWLADLDRQIRVERNRIDIALGALEGMREQIAPFHAVRATSEYQAAFTCANPLVSVCIATSNRAELLVERAIRSVREQTYRHLQIIVVGDHTMDDTESRLAALGDDRIQFVNLPERGPYPPPGDDRWYVAGVMAMNKALSLCTGHFVTHLDDDDAMEGERVETLLAAAREHRADFLWHPFWSEGPDGAWRQIGDGRLELGSVTTGALFYHRYFASIGWDVYAYRLAEPGDWNRIRKIKMLRPRLHFVDRPLLRHYAERRQPTFERQPGERLLE
jgi:acetyltransferase-like isoleucine patch superfamily enzyme